MKNDIKLHNFIQKFNLNISVNQFIYYLSHAFILSHFFNEDLVSEYEAKSGINLAFYSLSFIFKVLKYLVICAVFIFLFKDTKNMFIFYFFLYVVIDSIFNKITKFTIKEYNLLRLLRFDANRYGKYKIKYAIFSNIFYQLLPMLLISKFLHLNILIVFITFISAIGIKLIIEYIFLERIKNNNYYLKNKYFLKIIVFVLLTFFTVIMYFLDIYIPNKQMIYLGFIIILVSVVLLRKVLSFNYDKLYKANLNEDFIIKQRMINNVTNQEKMMVRSNKEIYDINQKDDKNTGYKYLFSMFIKRNSKNYIGNHKKLYIITFVICLISLFLPKILNETNIIDLIFNYNYILFIIVYYLCLYSNSFLYVCFMDIDRFLINYNFYRSQASIKENMMLRLKYTVKRNIVPSFAFSIIIILFYLMYNPTANFSKVLVLCLLPIILSMFYSMYYLFCYYIFQPYSFEGTIVNKFSKVFDGVIWIITYFLFDYEVRFNLLSLSITTLILFIISIIFYYIIVTKGTKSFRVR